MKKDPITIVIDEPIVPLLLARKLTEILKPLYDYVYAQQVAWWLLELVTKQSQPALISQQSIKLSRAQHQQLTDLLDQLINKKKPIAYIIGSMPFAGITLFVQPPVLIPRPETEEWTIELIEQLTTADNTSLRILDVCTGSGAIGLALAQALPHATVILSDCAPHALALAQKNKTLNKSVNTTIVESDLFENLNDYGPFDLIVTNPPYIDEKLFNQLDESVQLWEDKNALIADDQGLALIKKIINQAPKLLSKKHSGQLVIEIGYDQGEMVKQLLEHRGYNTIIIHKDLSGKNRWVTAYTK